MFRQRVAPVEEALRVGDRPRASRLAAELIAAGFEHPRLLVLAVYHQLDFGRAEQGLVLAERARKLEPRDVDVLNAVGVCLAQLDRAEEALKLFEQALKIAPGAHTTHRNMAGTLQQLSRMKLARAHFLRAFSILPADSDSAMQVAHLAAQRGDMAEARDFGARALKLNPNQTYASFAVASADLAEGKLDAARARLSPIAGNGALSPTSRAVARSMLGDVEDAGGNYAAAFGHYATAGSALREVHAPQFAKPGQMTSVASARQLAADFGAREPDSWRKGAAETYAAPVKTHVFILSFPRSGTTFLGQILAAHPDIEVMEERLCLEDSLALIEDKARLGQLATMSSAELDPLRDAYWRRVRNQDVSLAKPVFVDKLPLNSVALPLIAKLFPDAKVLFAVRDPRDVVFSCFRRRFGMSHQMYELVTLEKAAAYYDAVMTLSAAYRRAVDLELHDMRYEALARDFVEGARGLCAVVGVDYDANMENFVSLARERHIDTPSAAQLARGVSDRSGHWRNYREYLSPVMPILAPWVERYGYNLE
jgi:tetratricopeptide (TPR) repeat protein